MTTASPPAATGAQASLLFASELDRGQPTVLFHWRNAGTSQPCTPIDTLGCRALLDALADTRMCPSCHSYSLHAQDFNMRPAAHLCADNRRAGGRRRQPSSCAFAGALRSWQVIFTSAGLLLLARSRRVARQ